MTTLCIDIASKPDASLELPNWQQWCRTLEAVASSIDPERGLEYAAACATAWGNRLWTSASSLGQ
jgi:hypothetical protein